MSEMAGYTDLIESMIKEEKKVVKDVAIREVNAMDGISIDSQGNVKEMDGDGKEFVVDESHVGAKESHQK